MVDTKKEKLVFILLTALLLVFPLGQILRIKIPIEGFRMVLHPIDILAGIFLTIFIFGKFKRPEVLKNFFDMAVLVIFSSLMAISYFGLEELLPGAFYLLRVIAYITLGFVTWGTVHRSEKLKKLLFYGLILVTLLVAILGWLQYIFVPDLRYLKYFGWDDHLFRLVGTFLDPTFTAIILTFGALLSLSCYFVKGGKVYFLLGILLMITLAFTYSRAAFLAFSTGAIYLAYRKKSFKIFLIVPLFLLTLLFLPRPQSEGAQLERTKSIKGRLNNYSETLTIFSKFPLFGVGFNNMCVARVNILGDINPKSHSCSGSDSSILLILATTGVVGFMGLFGLIIRIFTQNPNDLYGISFKAVFISVLMHSQFGNSLTYPHVMVFLAILFATTLPAKEKT